MSSNTNNIIDTTQQTSPTAVQPSSADPSVAGNVAAANPTKQTVSAFTTVSSLGDLKQKAPELYHYMMLGIATSMIGQMQDDQQRLKQMMREGET